VAPHRIAPVDALGIDIGGTKIAGARVSPEGQVLSLLTRKTLPDSPEEIIAAVADLVNELDAGDTIHTVGVAAAAFLNRDRDLIYLAPNISWRDFPISRVLHEALGRPVVVENDANAAGWAEYRFGAGRDARSMMMLTLGTGVGGAVVTEGQLLVGGFGAGAELGHIIIEPGGRLCGCGNRGCLEQYASGTALVREARERLGRDDVSSSELMELFQAGSPEAFDALEAIAQALGQGIASLVAVTDPDIIVIGGGVAAAGDVLTESITRHFIQAYGPSSRRPVAQIVPAQLGNTAGAVGAADLARRQHRASP